MNPLLQQRHKHSSLSESQNSTASSSQLSFKYSKERTGALSVRSTASVSNRIGTRLSTAKSSDSSQSDASAFAAGVKPPASPRQPLALRKDRTATHSENLTHRRTSHQWHDLTQDDEDEDDLDDMNDKIRRKNVTRPSVSESKTMQSNPNTSLLSLKKHNMASNKQSPKKSTRGECRISSNLSSRPTMDRSIRLSVEDPLHFVVTADRRDPAAAYNGLTDTSDDDDTFLSDMRPLGGSKHASTTVPANNGRVGSFLDKSSPESDAKRRRKVAEECQKAAQVEEYQSVISNFRSKNEKTKSRKRKAPHVLSTTQQKPSSDSVLSQTTCSESRSGRSISKCAQQPPARLLSQGFESSLGRFHARSRLAEPVREDISNNSSDDESFFRKQKKLKRLSRNITAGTSSNRGKEDTDSITTTFTSSQNASGSRAFHSRGKERGNSMKSSTVLSHARRPLQAVALSTTSWGSTTTGMMRDD